MTDLPKHHLIDKINDPREHQLAVQIFKLMFGIVHAEQIYKYFGKLRGKIQNKSNKEMERVAVVVAIRVHNWCEKMKASDKKLNAEMINSRVKMELEHILR